MKRVGTKLISIIIIGTLSFSGCELFVDPCKKTKWETSEEPVIIVTAKCNVTSIVHNNITYKISEASEVSFTGTITKYYCGDKKSGSFDFSTTIYPIGGTLSLDKVKVGGPYQFTFQNDNDYLLVNLRMRVVFPDGTVFRPTEDDSMIYNYSDISYNLNYVYYQVIFTISESTTFKAVK